MQIFKFVKFFFLVLVGFVLTEAGLRFSGRYSNYLSIEISDIEGIAARVRNQDTISDHHNVEIMAEVPRSDYRKLKEYRFSHLPVDDFSYGIGSISNFTARDILIRENRQIWDVSYVLDEFGRRRTPASETVEGENFVVMYGGSRTFGQGVADDETLPNQFQKLLPNYKVYNYGLIAAGPNIFLKKHQNNLFKKEIWQQAGLFLYNFDYGHAGRALGNKFSFQLFGAPCYDIGENGELVSHANFWVTHFFRTAFFYLGTQSSIYQNTFLKTAQYSDFHYTSDELAIINKIFLQMRDEAAKFNNSDFAVVFFRINEETSPVNQVIQSLSKSGIKVLVFESGLLPPFDKEHYFEFDGHPTAVTYRHYAKLLLSELKKRRLVRY